MKISPRLASCIAAISVAIGVEASEFTVLERTVIFRHTSTDSKDPANLSGLNHGPTVTTLPDGRLMAAWFSAPKEGADSQRVMQAVSADQGRSWTNVQVLQDTPGRADFDPSLFAAGKETFLFYSVASPLDVWFRQSHDSGGTWTEPASMGQPNHTTRSNGIQLSSGELLVPLHLRGTKGAGVMKSSDSGKTWERFGMVVNPAGQGGEPTIAQTSSGKVLMMLRTKDGELWCSESTDKGETWDAPHKTGLTATMSASHLLCTRDGTLVLTLNPDRNTLRFPLVIHVSRDEGRTWSAAEVLADRPEKVGGWSICYPSVTELADGILVVVWTQIKNTSSETFGDIHAARVKVHPASAR